jgi:TonB-linked SusC/RagA family outer membrane protein
MCEYLLKMKLLALLFFVSGISLTARSYSQQTKFDLNLDNVSVRQVFQEIENNSEFIFLYSEKSLNVNRRVNLHVKNQSVMTILDHLFKGTPNYYEINDRQIAIMSKDTPEVAAETINGNAETEQKNNISGSVIDAAGEPLVGVTVLVKETSTGTITDINGRFSLATDQKNPILIFSYIGYETREVAANGRTQLPTVQLKPIETDVEEVVVTGYRTVSRERATGAFGIIPTKTIDNKLQRDLKSMLEGQVAGLTMDNNGNLEIRGVSTFAAVKTPLLVIDGYPVDATMNDAYFSYRDGTFENINANNVESITVLKDAVAASIYGSRAANGVIVITTKKGTEGDPKISYRGTFSIVSEPDLHNLHKSSASDYIDAEIDLFNQNPVSDLNSAATEAAYILIQERAGAITSAQAQAQLDALRKRDYIGQAQEYLFRPKLSHQHNVSLNGGTAKHTYNMVFNIVDTEDHFINSGNTRAVVDFKDEWKLNKYITLGANVNIAYSTTFEPTNNANDMLAGNTSGLFTFTTEQSQFTPYTQIVDASGKRTKLWIPGWQAQEQLFSTIPGVKNLDYVLLDEMDRERTTSEDFQSRLTGFLKFNIIDGLTAEIGGNWQRGNFVWKQVSDEDSYTVRYAYNASTSKSNPINHYIPEGAIINERRNINESWTLRGQVNYNQDFQDRLHRVNLLAGYEMRRMTYNNNTYATRMGFNPTAGTFVPVDIKGINAYTYYSDMYTWQGFSPSNGSYSLLDNRFESYYGNGSYEYNNRYILSGSIRLDLTNFFGTSPKYRYRPLWSVGGTWKVSEESFFDVDFLNRLHLRGSFGVSGNIALNQGPFMILSAGSYNTTAQGTSYGISSPPNDELRWEKTQTTNLGLDLSTLNNALKISIDYYSKKSTDLLAPDIVDATTGFTSVTKNIGSMSNKGLEIAISANVLRHGDFRWNITHIFAYNDNKVLTYNATRNYASYYYQGTAGDPGAVHVAGYPAASFWGGRFAGLNDQGAAQAYKADGTIVPIANLGTADVVYQGTTRPKFDLSLTNSFTYKDFDLSFMFIAKLGHSYRKDAFTGSNIQSRFVSQRWRQAGDEATTIYPVLSSWNMDAFYFPFVDVLVGDASFCKLRDLTLSYNLPQSVTGKLGLSGARIYLQGRNLLTFTAKGTDIDPESFEYNLARTSGGYIDQAFTSLPFPREYYFGLQFGF